MQNSSFHYTDTHVWTSSDVRPGFQSQGGSTHFLASSSLHKKILRFTSGAIPADLLAANMAAELFSSVYSRTSVGGARVRMVTDGILYCKQLKGGREIDHLTFPMENSIKLITQQCRAFRI